MANRRLLSQSEVDQLRGKVLDDLFAFGRGVLRHDYLDANLHYPLCQFLQQCPKRGLVVLPRSFLKTTTVRAYCIWRAVRNPNIRILYVTNSEPNAKKFIHALKEVFERNDAFQQLFPETIPDFAHTRWSDLGAEINRDVIGYPEATFEAAGVGTNIIGRHYDLIIEDDTLAPRKDDVSGEELMPMQEEIDKVIGWHKLATPLLVDPQESEILVVGTRWTYADLIQHILEMPEEQESRLTYRKFQRKCRAEDGTPTYPTRFPDDVLKGVERDLGPYLFNALYMNQPVAAGRQVFKREWLHDNMYQRKPSGLRVFMAVDAAYSLSGSADYTAIIVAGISEEAHLYVLDYVRARMYPKEIVESIFTLARAHPGLERIAVEAVAAQVALTYDIEDKMFETETFFTVDAIRRRAATKEHRIGRLQPLAANRRVHVRETHQELIHEFLTFPFGRNDDLVDALSDIVPYIGLPSTVTADELPADHKLFRQTVDGEMEADFDTVLVGVRKGQRSGMPFDVQLSPDNRGPVRTTWTGGTSWNELLSHPG